MGNFEVNLLFENYYKNKFLLERLNFLNENRKIFGYRTEEFWEAHRAGLEAQKIILQELYAEQLTIELLQEKFGDQFAAKMASYRSKAANAAASIATVVGFGTLGKFIQKKVGKNECIV